MLKKMAGNLTESFLYIENSTVSTTIVPSPTVIYDYMDFELPILIVVTVLFCLSTFVLCVRARRNWNRRLRERQSHILTSHNTCTLSSSVPVSSQDVSAYPNPGFSYSITDLENMGIPDNREQPAFVIPTQMILPPTYIDLPPSYEDAIKEANNAQSSQVLPQGPVETGLLGQQVNILTLHGLQQLTHAGGHPGSQVEVSPAGHPGSQVEVTAGGHPGSQVEVNTGVHQESQPTDGSSSVSATDRSNQAHSTANDSDR